MGNSEQIQEHVKKFMADLNLELNEKNLKIVSGYTAKVMKFVSNQIIESIKEDYSE